MLFPCISEASHYRGGAASYSINSSGLVTVTVYTGWGSFVDTPFFQVYTGSGATGTSLGSMTLATAVNPFSTGTEFGGAAYTIRKDTFTFNLNGRAAGFYYAWWSSNNWVSGINNVPESTWSLELKIAYTPGQASAGPTMIPATIDIIGRGFPYTQNLNSQDPDGTPVTYQNLVGNAYPDYAPTSLMPGISVSASGTVGIPGTSTATMALGRWGYKIRVTDGSGGTAIRDVLVVAADPTATNVNRPPVLASIGPKTVNIGTSLNFTVTGNDPDAGQTLTLRSSALPTGATFPQTTGPSTGASSSFAWTPTAGQEGTYVVNFEVYDNASVTLIDSEEVTFTVTGSNNPPVLAAVGSKSVANGGTLTFNLSATDPDGHSITYQMFNGPAGATLSPAGAFSWTPTAGQNNTTYTGVTLRATDNGVPNLSDNETITITVGAGNNQPVTTATLSHNVTVGQNLSFVVSGSDVDLAQTLTLSANAGIPSGATFTTVSGLASAGVSSTFSWTPTSGQVGLTTVKFLTQDNGTPVLNQEITVTINVAAASPEIVLRGNGLTIDNGDMVPTTADHTSFGNVAVSSGSISRTFTIANTGTGALNLTGTAPNYVTLSGANAADFTVSTQPASSVVASGSTTFVVTFDPSSFGFKNATVSIANNDADENPYTFAITGGGADSELVVFGGTRSGNGILVADGASSTALETDDHIDYVNVTYLTPTTLSVSVRWFPSSSGSYTTTDGIHLKVFHFNGSTWNTLQSLNLNPGQFSVNTHTDLNFTFTLPSGSPTGTHHLRASIIDKSAAGDIMVGNYACESCGTAIGSGRHSDNADVFFDVVTGSPASSEIAITGNGNAIVDGSATAAVGNHTDFGNAGVTGSSVVRTFTIVNTGTAALNLSGTAPNYVTLSGATADFAVTAQPVTPVSALTGTTTFSITFDPASVGQKTATVTLLSDDADESPYTFTITGNGQAPLPIPSTLDDVVTAGNAPGADGTSNIGQFGVLRRGGFLAENGFLAFPGFLQGVPATSNSGLWKTGGGNLFLLARTGTTVPDVPSATFATLPEVPWISESGLVSFLASMTIGTGGVTTANDTGLWSEIGGGGLRLLLREDDDVPGMAGVKIGSFASGIYATASTGVNSGHAIVSVTFKGASTKSAVLRAQVSGATTTISVVAEESATAPGTTALYANVAGSFTDPGRMDAQGNFIFSALTTTSSKEGIWYQPVGSAVSKVFYAGETAPGTGGATFARLQRPSSGNNGVVAFRATLNRDGDNAANMRNDGIWRGTASTPASFTCILRRGDGSSVVSNLPVGSLVGNPWGGWLNNNNRGAWRAWLDVNGDGNSAAPTDVNAIFTDLSGAMQLALRVGDAAPGTTGATFSGFDLPIVGGNNQYAIIGNLAGGDAVTANNQGLWRSAPNGGALSLVFRKGASVVTTEGTKVVTKIDLPGSGQTDRRWEQPVMDSTGRIVVYVTFADGSTSQVIIP
ncbi:DUF7453 family protein [Prosthecobacter dejongeii]|uniref:Cadherin domain-containing protein n=1 Tax=Prosthecobacter dejongeii TaxID=48465 RepID=A0A7W7YPR6_9BACT|nr:choice-of-anchor D domain-containing protein [Prosthecobacter dejongeii]MBB5040074.1 hypothetical protein [Prosthecobacter dejongeii]